MTQAGNLTWDDFFARIDETLGQAVGNARAREEWLSAAAQKSAAVPPRPEAFDQHFRGLEERMQSAAQTMADVDAALQQSEDILRTYLSASESIRQGLETWASRGIG